MKKNILLLILLVVFSLLKAQNFQAEHLVSFGNIYHPSVMIPADFDNDGDWDILMNSPGNSISWVENFGNVEFGFQQDIETNIPGITDIFVNDIDNDGDQDILSASQTENSIYWYENDGMGNFSQANTISDSAFSAQCVYSIDIDGDGNNDVISGGWTGKKLAWYKNDGNGNFGFQNQIDDDLGKVQSVYAKDLDNDGDNDVIAITREECLLAWYENKNGGTLFEKHVITTSIDDGRSVYSADIDSDGDNDILSASFWDGKIAWYENDGNGSFGQQNIISENTGHAERVFASDLDNDGDLDVLSAFYSDQKVAWNENLGDGIFGEQIIISEIGGRKTVTACDIDNDGDEDILSNAYWYENDGTGNFGEAIFTITVVGLPYDVVAIDVDNDQDKDILYSSPYSGLLEYKNSGNFVRTALFNPDNLTQSSKVAVNDFNNDGNPDVFFGYLGALARYHIEPNGTIIYDGIIDTLCWEVKSMEFADFDNDGDKDILVSTSYFDMIGQTMRKTEIKWIENINNGNEWIPHQLYSHFSFGCSYTSKPSDIDNDGDIDIIATNCRGDTIYFFENPGNANFSLSKLKVTDDIYMNSFFLNDVDSDNDIDIVSTVYINDKGSYSAVWFENVDGDLFYDIHFIEDTEYAYYFLLDDVNDDGFADIVANNSLESIGFYYGDGTGNFELGDVFENEDCGLRSVSLNDMDNDGDLDVLYCDEWKNKIAWIENELNSRVDEFSKNINLIYPNPFSDVLKIDLLSNYNLDLYNSTGSKLFSIQNSTTNLSYLPRGIYLAIIKNPDGKIVSSQKLIKK